MTERLYSGGWASDTRRALGRIMRRGDQVSRHWERLTTLVSVRLSNVSGLAEEVWVMPDHAIIRGGVGLTITVNKVPRSCTWE